MLISAIRFGQVTLAQLRAFRDASEGEVHIRDKHTGRIYPLGGKHEFFIGGGPGQLSVVFDGINGEPLSSIRLNGQKWRHYHASKHACGIPADQIIFPTLEVVV